jgi:hypothetical protein
VAVEANVFFGVSPFSGDALRFVKAALIKQSPAYFREGVPS